MKRTWTEKHSGAVQREFGLGEFELGDVSREFKDARNELHFGGVGGVKSVLR